jgi:branched-chain amino acid transport system substrate-binding protein
MFTIQRVTARTAGVAAAATLVLATATACGSSSPSAQSSTTPATSTSTPTSSTPSAPAGTFAGKAATGSPVKVGLMNPEGGTAVNQPEGRIAAQAAVDYANANLGGLGGHKIVLDVCKTKEEDPSSLTGCANQMVQDKVVGVVETNTGNGPLIVPIITGAGIAYTSYQGASAQEMGTPNAFLWTAGVPGVSIAMAKAAAAAGAKSFTMFVTANGNTAAAVQGMASPIFQAAHIALTVTPIPLGTPDASPQVAAGLKSNPGAVAIIGDATMCTSTLKGLDTVGSSVPRYVIQPCMDPSVYKADPKGLDGAYLYSTSDGSGSDKEAQVFQAVMAKYAPGQTTGGAAPTGYQSMLGFIRAVDAGIGSKDVTAANVISAIKAAKNVPLPAGGGIVMNCNGKQLPQIPNVCSSAALVGQIENGTVAKFQVIK